LELRILGPLEVVGDDGLAADVGGRRPQTVLVALALARGHPVPADQLLDDVWRGERLPDRNRLQIHISRLRRALGDDRISTRGGGYALEIPAEAVDAARFDQLVADGRVALQAADAAAAARLLREGLSLWRGSPLPEFADDEFARPVIARLEESRLAATEDRIEADLMLGRHGELAGELDALVQEHPLRERLWGQLMVALYRAGRQGDALRAYQRARTVLADELGVDPGPELKRLEGAVLSQDPALGAPAAQQAAASESADRIGNLPAALAPLIGRQDELNAVTAALQGSRLLTVVGAGGVGKTRLAIEVARSVLGGYRDGAWLIELAPVADASAVAAVVGASLGIELGPGPGAAADMLQRLGEFLSRRQALLVLDNCEHVADGAARVVVHLLARCGELRILATSRESLAVAGESLWPLPPLALDDAGELFMARARAIAPSFQADETATATVRRICARLDGLPLAIELAAARMRAFTPGDVLARLDDRFRLLTGGFRTAVPRQQTLRAVVDWSYDLLFDQERRVFERMSVFASDCPLDAAEQVCADDMIPRDDIADLLARLVDKSLVIAIHTKNGVRFRLLQTLAEYGRERLAGSGDRAAVCARHARWVASFTCVAEANYGPAWSAAVSESLDDIRQAMESALGSGDGDTALAIACGLLWFWDRGGVIDDLWRWLTAALALKQPASAQRVRALAIAEHLGLAQGRDQALSYGEQAVALGRAVGDRPALAFALALHGSALGGRFDQREQAVTLLEEAGMLREAEGDDWSLAAAASARGVAALARADPDRAWPLLRLAADGYGRLGNPWAATTPLRQLADLAILRSSYDDAISALREAVSGLRAVGAAAITSMLAARLGYLCSVQGRIDEADRWHAYALAVAEKQQHLPMIAFACNSKGVTLRHRDRLDEAAQCHHLALDLCNQRGIPTGLAAAHASLGYIAELRRDAATALRHHQASLDAAFEAADRRAQALALEGLAGVASLRDDPHTTGLLLGAAAALREATVATMLGAAAAAREMTVGRLTAAERNDIDRAIARLHEHATLDAAFAEGYRDPQAVLKASRAAQRSWC